MIENNTLTLIPELDQSQTYQIAIPKGAIKGTNGLLFDGFSDYMITTMDSSEPVLVRTVPAMNGEIGVSGSIEFYFNKDVMLTGNWTASISCENTVLDIPADIPVVVGSVIAIPFEIPSALQCSVVIEESSISDLYGNEYTEPIYLSFRTSDSNKPEITLHLQPIDDLQEASRISDIILYIEDATPVTPSLMIDGGISVRSTDTIFLYTANMITVEDNKVVLANHGRFQLGETISVDVPAGMFVDGSGNTNERAQFTFVISSETVKPEAQTLSSTSGFDTDVLQLQFSSVVTLGTGSVMMTCQDCDSVLTIANSALYVDDRILSIPYSGALSGHAYIITLEPDVVYNIFGNGNDLVTLEEMVTIHSAQRPVLVKEECIPSDNAHSVPLSTTISLVFDQSVRVSETCALFALTESTYATHNATLLPLTEGLAAIQQFSVENLLPFTVYTVEISVGCFLNEYGVENEESSLSFTTTRNSAPSVVSFNLEGQLNVLLDAALTFTFDQELEIAANASILVKPHNEPAIQRTIDAVQSNSFTIYNTETANRFSFNTEYTVLIPEGVVCNSDRLCMSAITFNPFTTVAQSYSNVILQYTTPASGAVRVPQDSRLTLHFSGSVRSTTGSSGLITVLEDSQLVEGTMEIQEHEVTLIFPLRSGRTYTYMYDDEVLSSLDGSPVVYDMGSSLSFTVIDTEGPEHYAFEVSEMQSVVIRFNENIMTGNGTLVVRNSQGEAVLPPIATAVESTTTVLTVNVNGESLPDDIYEFVFSEGFVTDLAGNPSPAFTEYFAYDRVPPFITSVTAPVSVLGPFVLLMNEPVNIVECDMDLVDGEEKHHLVSSLSLIEVDSQTYHLMPAEAWSDNTSYTLLVPAGCFVDERNVTSAVASSFIVQTPATVPLSLNAEECSPAVDEAMAIGAMVESTVTIVFDTPVQYMNGKLVELRNDQGCLLADASSLVVSNASAVFSLSSNIACFSGNVLLVADEGAFLSLTSGAKSPASTLLQSLYSFHFLPAGPKALSATAVYTHTLQVSVGSRVDVTFDKNITAPSDLSYLQFLSCAGEVVPLATRIHSEIVGPMLRLVVDEVSTQPSQVCSVEFLPVLPSQGVTSTVPGEDAAVGIITLDRLFSLPLIMSTISAVGEGELLSVQPTLEFTFDQPVRRSSDDACPALLIHDALTTYTVAIRDIVSVSSTVFRWTPSESALLTVGTEYSFMLDNSCFVLLQTDAPASEVSSVFYATVGVDTVGPVVVGLSVATETTTDLQLTSTSPLFVVFNEPVQIVENSFAYLMNTEDGSVVQVPSAELTVREGAPTFVEIPWRQLRLATPATYTVRLDSIARDAAGNLMQSMTLTCRVHTPAIPPMPVTNIDMLYLQTGVGLLSFDAAVDTSLSSAVSLPGACHYTVTVLPMNRELEFDDVCVGRSSTQAVRLAVVITSLDPELSSDVSITVHNNHVNDFTTAYFSTVADVLPAPQTPDVPVLLSVSEEAVQVQVSAPVSYTQSIVGYTFLLSYSDDSMAMYSIEASPFTSEYSIPLSAESVRPLLSENDGMELRVKATSSTGSSGFSDPLTIMNLDVTSTVPEPVNATSVELLQISSDAMQLTWAPANSRELITGYRVVAGNTTVVVTEPSVVLQGLEDGVVFVSIVAINAIGESEATEIEFDFSSTITASVLSVTSGASYAVATFAVSFTDAAVECAINAGQLVHGYATVNAAREASVVFTGLISSCHYAGLCWAYSISGSAVSDSVSLAFTTSATADVATLTVDNFVVESLGSAEVTVDIDVPATVYCTLARSTEQLLHTDIVTLGQKTEVLFDGPKTMSFTALPADSSIRLFCTAEDTNGRRLVEVSGSEPVTVPNRLTELSVPACSIADGAEDVSLRPVLQFVFDRAVKLNDDAVLVIENMETHDAYNATGVVEGSVATFTLSTLLEPASKYTYYSTDRLVSSVDDTAVLQRFIYGASTFTTTSDISVPSLLTASEDLQSVDPSSPITLTFDRAMHLLTPVPAVLTYNSFDRLIPASQISVAGESVAIEPFGLTQSVEYSLTLPECLLADVYGHCFPETTVTFTTGVDEVRPLVLESQPRNEQVNVPNDVPLRLSFNEEVSLFNVENLVVRTNGQQVPLNVLDVKVEGREVLISIMRGYSRGNENLPFIEVEVTVNEDAFRDLAGNSNEMFSFHFTAAPQRCGSSYLSGFMEDTCRCYSEGSKCYCDCGPVDLFEM